MQLTFFILRIYKAWQTASDFNENYREMKTLPDGHVICSSRKSKQMENANLEEI